MAAGTTESLYVAVDEPFLRIAGVQLVHENTAFGDYVAFKLVDKDGVAYPAGTELSVWATKWFVPPGDGFFDVFPGYKSGTLPQGFYFKIEYTSVGATDVNVAFNLHIHKELV